MSFKNKESLIHLIGFVFLVAQCLCMVEGKVHFYEFVLTEKNFTKLCNTSRMLVVNGSIPGPVIRVHKGDTMYVNVHNHGHYGVTIHWHGVKQPRNPWSDGPEYITQCPIEPGSNFTYEVIFSTEEGTLWWHAHSDWTRAYVHGAIVILPAIGTTYPFPKPDEEDIIVLGSWYSGNLKALVDDSLYYGSDLPHSVDQGKTYLLRLVNAIVAADMFFAVAQHNLTIVGMDAHYIKPITTSYIMISPGQTMDILLTANQSLGQYYMAARQFWSQNVKVTEFDHVNTTAIIEYKGNYTIPSSPSFPSTLPIYKDLKAAIAFSKNFRSLASKEHPVNVPLNVTTKMYITLSISDIACRNSTCTSKGNGTDILATSANNISWSSPIATNILLAYYRNISGVYTTDFPDEPLYYFNFTADDLPVDIAITDLGTKVKVLNYNDVVEVVFQGTNLMEGAGTHPIHLHGYSFYVVGTGVWFWHCHLDRHMTWGMSAVFIIKNGDTAETSIREPPPYLPPCKVPLQSWLQNNDGSNEKEN
ncbi:laccase-15 [Quercus suber]|uniref:Laccase-15 n=1 Tax=Quercus suber TaxID=58331 RepID=A0AAW0M293_QUESU